MVGCALNRRLMLKSIIGPVFRPEDIMGLFGSIASNGAGMGMIAPPQLAGRPAYPERESSLVYVHEP
jgi:hypothetical protein